MVYKLPVKSRIEFIALKIRDINQMVDFYTKVIGLYLIKRTENQAYLGIPSQRRVFISLRRINHPFQNQKVARMRSFTLILPNKDSLKKIMVHINNLGIKIPNVRVNANLNLFYLHDPEGNCVSLGIKNASRSKSNSLSTEALNSTFKKVSLNHYLKNFKLKSDKLPEDTKFGWVEMSVSKLQSSLKFYHHQLGLEYQINAQKNRAMLMTDQDNVPQVILDQDSSLKSRNLDSVGFDYMNIKMTDPSEITKLANNFSNNGIKCQFSKLNHFIFVTDPDNINITISLL